MEKASAELEFDTAALYRDRLAALSAIQSQQGINPRTVEEADVFAIHQEGGYSCVEVFFFRTGQNWGNRAYFPRAEKSFTPEEVLSSFVAQFYDDKPPPRLILLSHEIEECRPAGGRALGQGRLQGRGLPPQRGEKKEFIAHALTNAREALGRKLADTATQAGCCRRWSPRSACRRRRSASRSTTTATSRAPMPSAPSSSRGRRLHQEPVPQVQHQVRGPTPGDDYAMMREVLQRRFKRLLTPPDGEAAKPRPTTICFRNGPTS